MSASKTPPAERHPLFQLLPQDIRADLFAKGKQVSLHKGEALIRENEFNESLYLLTKGSAKVVINGTEVASLVAGDIAGEISSAGLSPPIADVIAESELGAIALPIGLVNDISMDHPEFAAKMRDIGMRRVYE